MDLFPTSKSKEPYDPGVVLHVEGVCRRCGERHKRKIQLSENSIHDVLSLTRLKCPRCQSDDMQIVKL